MKNVTFTGSTISIQDQVFSVVYTISEDQTIFAHVCTIENGEAVSLRIKFAPDSEHHAEALAAAMQAERPDAIFTAQADEQPEASEPEPVSEPEQEPARDPKKARGEVPEKLFAGLEIVGNGWKILFDKTYDRTRVIFKEMPSKAAREACKNAGFYWSPALKSWNKKLTFKAFRKAQTLAVELRTICG